MRISILMVSVLGIVLCAGLLALSFAAPLQVEKWARHAIEQEVQRKVEARWQGLEMPDPVRAAEHRVRQHADEISQARRSLVELAVREMQDPDCPCRRKSRELDRSGLEGRVDQLGALKDRLRQVTQVKYAEVSAALLRELRIFVVSNAVVFALLGVVVFVRRRATVQLLAPAAVLLGAAGMVASVYVFSQNWLQTILLSDYVGWAYVPWLGLAITGLADVVWNRARACTLVVNVIATALGVTLTAVSC